MFVDKAGEHLADIMTLNRGLSSIPSASAILDTSNYTFQAVTFGKDADGFRYHAHKILSPSGDGIIKVTSYGNTSFSGYSTSTTASALQVVYSIYPAAPKPTDTKIEHKSTLPNYSSGVSEVGHCLNAIINQSLYPYAHLIGCFPAASGTTFKILDTQGNIIFTSSVSSFYNNYQLLDSSGYLTFYNSISPASQVSYKTGIEGGNILYASAGALRTVGSEFPVDVDVVLVIASGDAGALNLFGGVYHLGLWCLDIKEMLKQGYSPPFSFNPLNNIRKYKLFAKKTFNRDLISYTNNSAFKSMFVDGVFSNNVGIIIKWKIRFV